MSAIGITMSFNDPLVDDGQLALTAGPVLNQLDLASIHRSRFHEHMLRPAQTSTTMTHHLTRAYWKKRSSTLKISPGRLSI